MGTGRPKLPPDEVKDSTVIVRMTDAERTELECAAATNGRTLAEETRARLLPDAPLSATLVPRLRGAIERYTRLKSGESFALVYGVDSIERAQYGVDLKWLADAFCKLYPTKESAR